MSRGRRTLADYGEGYQGQIMASLHPPRPATAKLQATPQPETALKRGKAAASPIKRATGKGKAFTNAIWGNLPEPVKELRFSPPRRWRFDYAWEAGKVALEVEGGVWTGGRHTRGKGFLADMEKYNTATVMGWRVLRVTPDQLKRREHLPLLIILLE